MSKPHRIQSRADTVKVHFFIACLLILSIKPISFAYQVNTHRAISQVAATRNDSNVQYFLTHELLMSNGIYAETTEYGSQNLKSLLGWIQEGAEREDDFTIWPFGRFLKHFYNPINGAGLNDFIGGIGSGQQSDSLRWAWGGNGIDNGWSWLDAREYYFGMLATPWEEDQSFGGILVPGRKSFASSTFRSLGQIIHLIQDLGQPQHTRNDAHTPFEGAPFESYCSFRYGTPEQIANLQPESLPYFARRFPSRLSLNRDIPEEFSNLWDTDQYNGSRPTQYFRGSLGLAEYSNAFFVTDDTLFTGANTEAFPLFPNLTIFLRGAVFSQHVFPHPMLNDTNIGQALRTGIFEFDRLGESPVVHNSENPILLYDNQIPINVASYNAFSIFLTDQNRESHARKLIPKTVSYSIALLNYFFRGRISVTSRGIVEVQLSPDDTSNKLKYHELLVTNRSGETISGGDWYLFADGLPGQEINHDRVFYLCFFTPFILPFYNIQINPNGYRGVLRNNESFTVWVPPHDDATGKGGESFPWEIQPATMVFKGTMGNERDTGIIAKRFSFQ